MSILRLETEFHCIEDMKALKKALKNFNVDIVMNIPIIELKYIFNEYLIDNLDINLFDYDVSITETVSTITVDMSYVKEESDYEYEYIISELKSHFGKSIIKIEDDDDNAVGIINIKAALRTLFSNASEINIVDDSIELKIRIEEVDDKFIKKYFLD